MKIKKGDHVMVMAGKDKGATGTVIAAYPATSKVVVMIALKSMDMMELIV